MRLQPCLGPVGPIEPAPVTDLVADDATVAAGAPAGSELAGFWAADDHYYLRRRDEAGVRWFVGLLDDAAADAGTGDAPAGVERPIAAIERACHGARVMLVGRQHGPTPGRVHVWVHRRRHQPSAALACGGRAG